MGVDPDPVHHLSTEPLLQHYGVETRWLDVVDALPHALFFATHALVNGQLPGTKTWQPSLEQYGFIYVIEVGMPKPVRRSKKHVMGFHRTSLGIEVADLRALKPSNALRPHAQHGLAIRPPPSEPDLWPRVAMRIAVPTRLARSWISAPSLGPEELFPPRVWDNVYGVMLGAKMQALLEAERTAGRSWGEILRFDFAE